MLLALLTRADGSFVGDHIQLVHLTGSASQHLAMGQLPAYKEHLKAAQLAQRATTLTLP